MTAEKLKKFLFDTDFGLHDDARLGHDSAAIESKETEAAQPVEEIVPEPPPPPTFSEEELADARAEGFQAGRDEAIRDMAGAMEQHQANTLDAIDAKMTEFFEAYSRDIEEHNRDAVAVARTIVQKLFPAMNMDKALVEIEHMVVEAMRRTAGSPALIIHVAPDLQANIEAKVQDLSVQRGHEGTITVMADKTLEPGDAKVEWEGGAMIRDTQAMWRDIDEIIERNLGATHDAPRDDETAEHEN